MLRGRKESKGLVFLTGQSRTVKLTVNPGERNQRIAPWRRERTTDVQKITSKGRGCDKITARVKEKGPKTPPPPVLWGGSRLWLLRRRSGIRKKGAPFIGA